MLHIFLAGGPVMYPLLICSILALAVIIERFFFYARYRGDSESLMREIRAALAAGRPLEAVQVARRYQGPVAGLATVALAQYGKPRWFVSDQLEKAGQEEIAILERGIPLLDTMVTISPLLGLLGTVTGIIRTFNVLGALHGISEPTAMSVGIAEALVTTAFGLIIAIPSMAASAYFSYVVDRHVLEMNRRSGELLALVASEAAGLEAGGRDAH
ncbi:MAG: MotA/TolQ/ExbB proton channel family protein [Firmicutes bacterium]|nr:MotA/TolQ/ExbB proton channel family protein [Bacillota bacterium]